MSNLLAYETERYVRAEFGLPSVPWYPQLWHSDWHRVNKYLSNVSSAVKDIIRPFHFIH